MTRSDDFAARVASQPDNELFRFSLAQALLLENRPADAAPHLEYCALKKPEWMMPRILLGNVFLELKQTDGARQWLGEALSLAIAQHHEAPEAELRALLANL